MVLGLIIIFLAGTGTGVAGTVYFLVHRLEYVIHHPENVPRRLTNYLSRNLKLSDAQATQVKSILINRQAALLNISRQVNPQVQQQLDLMREQIAAVLDEKQKQKWFGIFDRAHERWLPAIPETPATQPAD